ncbi:hypothetical protein V6N13_004288 [Hibiscus sabdariffa]|uniref:Uncharacterized protein n=1 Tax=Hibiscus sabdariffa TaxID=183260 RepID=A0ABR2RYL3_9ROSI
MAVVQISFIVHELGVMREAHLLPVGGIQIKLIIAIFLRRIDPINGYSITAAANTSPFSSVELVSFGLSILQNHEQLRQVLDPRFARVGTDTSSIAYDDVVEEIVECGLGVGAARKRSWVDGEGHCRTLRLRCFIQAVLTETDINGDNSLTSALAEPASEFERVNDGMAAASATEASIEKMPKRVEIEAGDKPASHSYNI